MLYPSYELLRELLRTVDPRVAALLLVAAGALTVLLRRSRRPAPRSRTQFARDLAQQGLLPGEIARQTGLSRDAVALALRVAPAAGERLILPEAERISAPPAAPPARPTRLSFQQALAQQSLGRVA